MMERILIAVVVACLVAGVGLFLVGCGRHYPPAQKWTSYSLQVR